MAAAADQLIPSVHDFVIKGNIRLFRSAGFEALGPWLTQLRALDSLPAPDARRIYDAGINTDWKWALFVKGKVIQAPDGWVAAEVVEGLLESDGDFLLVGNLSYHGSRQLRIGGSDLRSSWEKTVGASQYLIETNRPRPLLHPHSELLLTLSALALGPEPESVLDKDEARDLIRNHLRTFQRGNSHSQQPRDFRAMAIQRVLAQWRWSV